jgi:heme exporter protein B
MKLLRQSFLVARKDLAIETPHEGIPQCLRSLLRRHSAALQLCLRSFSDTTREIAGGLLWMVFTFAGALVFNRGFARERPNECLDTLLSSTLSPASLVLGKAMANFVLLLIVELVSLFVFGIFYNTSWLLRPLDLVGICVLATWGISVIGASFGAMTVNLRLRELMLPVVIYPLLIPLLIAAIVLTNDVLVNQPLAGDQFLWGRLLVVFDIVFTALSLALADTILVN